MNEKHLIIRDIAFMVMFSLMVCLIVWAADVMNRNSEQILTEIQGLQNRVERVESDNLGIKSEIDGLKESKIHQQQDIYLLAQLIQTEAGNQSFEGQVAVAAVVLNRVKDSRFPESIPEVIYQDGQFCTAKMLYKVTPTEENLEAARVAMSGEDNTGGALFFYADYAQCKWIKSRPVIAKIGEHTFAV